MASTPSASGSSTGSPSQCTRQRTERPSTSTTASVYSHEFEVARRSGERTARLDAIYGSTVAAQGRSEAQPVEAPTSAEVADLQARRDGAQ